jgi:protein O-GlcNAc transferase
LAGIAEAFARALRLHEAGQTVEAETIYRRILAEEPRHVGALLLLGTLAQESGRLDEARQLLEQALALDDRMPELHYGLAVVLQAQGEADTAIARYRQAVALRPAYPEAHNNLAILLQQAGDMETALSHYAEALRHRPGYAEARNNLGTALAAAGRVEEAMAAYRAALDLDPRYRQAALNLGRLLEARGEWSAAAALYRETLDRDPASVELLLHRARALQNIGAWREAAGAYRGAAQLQPGSPEIQLDLGIALEQNGRLDEAETCYRNALRLNPAHAKAHLTLGLALQVRAAWDEAQHHFAEARQHAPDSLLPLAQAVIGRLRSVYRDEAEITAARDFYAAGLAELEAACRLGMPDGIAAALAATEVVPFYLTYQGEDDRVLQARWGGLVARILAAAYPGWAVPPEVPPPSPGERIRVGILSPNFRNHSNWKMRIKGWLKGLDRSRFALFGYHTGKHYDDETELAALLCDRFERGPHDIAAWAARIRADRLHVLLVPAVWMDPLTSRLAALRLAPVQAASWGHPDTTGLPTIDYFLSADGMEPEGAEAQYTEALVRLPGLSAPYEPPPERPRRLDRAALGLTEDAVLYWCCQALFKYLPRHDELFPRIAARVPKALFLFIGFRLSDGPTAILRRRLHEAFARAGLDAERYCRFLPFLDAGGFADVTRLADLFLDSLGWSGCNSALEALAQNLPVVTCPGPLMRSRHSAAILQLLDLPELTADSPHAYVELAVALGLDPERRRALSARIAAVKHRLLDGSASIQALGNFLEDAALRREVRHNYRPPI